jgi:hypothetical protein
MPTNTAYAFCGFYVSKADTKLFNKASKVVLARHQDRTVITMANDYQGDVKNFAIVVPVPVIVKKSQVNVTENRIIDHLDAYTAPRLVEYYDQDPCNPVLYKAMRSRSDVAAEGVGSLKSMSDDARAYGVTIEESYTVGEYDILVLSAKESDGLLKWLNKESYRLPPGAKPILKSYIRQDMKFFVAKVNLEKQEKSGYSYLRPLQVAYESNKFMLPIRLGTLNSDGPQDIIIFTLTKNGRVEPTNYRNIKIPSDMNIPLFVENEFGDFYKAMFTKQTQKEDLRAVFLEYAWDMSWCDPCAADPLPNSDLRTLGAWWVDLPEDIRPVPMQGRSIAPIRQQAANVFVTRLHARYTAKSFPEDLMLHETSDRQNFQGRYVMQHPWSGNKSTCEAAKHYYKSLPNRFEKEAQNLAQLTNWNINDIRKKMEENGQSFSGKPLNPDKPWWEQMWQD